MSIRHVEFDAYGYLDGASITASYQTLVAMSDDADVLFVFNNCDTSLILQIPSKLTTAEMRLPPKASFVLDGRTNSKRIAKGLIRVKYASNVPTAGEITVTVAR